MSVRTLPGLRFSCRSCADCCGSGLDLGPVEPSVVADLVASDIESLWAPAAEAPWFSERPGPEGPLIFLRQRNGRCIFLRDDNLCAVHALLGADRKPGFCREFPYHLVEEPRGWVAIARPSCGGLHRSHVDGEPVEPEELEAIQQLQRVVPRRRFAPETVETVPGIGVSLDDWLYLEDEVVHALEAKPDLTADAALATVRTTLYARLGRSAPAARPEQAVHATSAILQALQRVMADVLAQGAAGPPDRVRFAEASAERLERARQGIHQPMTLDPATDAYVHLLLRSQLIAKQWQAWGSVHAGLGQFHLGVMVARALATDGTPDGFAAPYRHWLHFSANGMIQHVLRSARVALSDVFLHVD